MESQRSLSQSIAFAFLRLEASEHFLLLRKLHLGGDKLLHCSTCVAGSPPHSNAGPSKSLVPTRPQVGILAPWPLKQLVSWFCQVAGRTLGSGSLYASRSTRQRLFCNCLQGLTCPCPNQIKLCKELINSQPLHALATHTGDIDAFLWPCLLSGVPTGSRHTP